jgi:hypothetical protein
MEGANVQLTVDAEIETEKWVSNTASGIKTSTPLITSRSALNGKQQTNPKPTEPQPSAFRIPSNPDEREDVITNMVSGGLPREEAAQSIALRRTAYNRAVKELKKTANKKQTRKSKSNQNSSRPVEESYFNYVD